MLDDRSRYVVAFGRALQQTGDLVIETLLDGIASFGKGADQGVGRRHGG